MAPARQRSAGMLVTLLSSALLWGCGGRFEQDPDPGTRATITIEEPIIFSDCTLGVAADTIVARWTAVISGAEGREAATLNQATLTVSGARTVSQHLLVEPVSAGLTNGAGSVEQQKIGADVDPGWVCVDVCEPSATWTLELEFDVGRASSSGAFYCPA